MIDVFEVGSWVKLGCLLCKQEVRGSIPTASTIGKSAVGKLLAERLGIAFFDFDREVEKFYSKPISSLRGDFLGMGSYREETAKVLRKIMIQEYDFVLSLPPDGLKGNYWRVIQSFDRKVICLNDRPENILERLDFYDHESKKISIELSEDQKRQYLKEIKKDISRFERVNQRADTQVDISGLGLKKVVDKIVKAALIGFEGAVHLNFGESFLVQ